MAGELAGVPSEQTVPALWRLFPEVELGDWGEGQGSTQKVVITALGSQSSLRFESTLARLNARGRLLLLQ